MPYEKKKIIEKNQKRPLSNLIKQIIMIQFMREYINVESTYLKHCIVAIET